MLKILKYIYKCIITLKVRSRGAHISPKVNFNNHTQFEGTNVVLHGSYVSDSYIGYGTYISYGTSLPNCQIGRYCSIGSNIKVVTGNHPSSVFVSTNPMFFSTRKQNGKTLCEKNKFEETLNINGRNLIIGNDVWIGDGVTFKGGVKIGDGAIIAMRACVTKDVPPYAIVGGVPAKIIRYRFTEEQIKRLLEIKWWNKSEEWIKQHSILFEDINDFINAIDHDDNTCNYSR